jgi:hypothetical protein
VSAERLRLEISVSGSFDLIENITDFRSHHQVVAVEAEEEEVAARVASAVQEAIRSVLLLFLFWVVLVFEAFAVIGYKL